MTYCGRPQAQPGPFKTRLRIKHWNKLVPIEGGRIMRSQEIKDLLRYTAAACADQQDTLAGFAIVTWDDNGSTLSQVETAHFTPYEPRDIPRVVRHEVALALRAGDDAETEDEYEGGEE